jgi:hypothetical protein
VIDLATAAAVTAVAAAAFAVGARDVRAMAAGLAVAMLAAPFAATPPPGALPLAARIAGALLGADLMWVGARVKGIRSDGSATGLPADAAVAAAAFLAGLWIVPVTPLVGPVTEQAAGVALVVLAIVPLAGRDAQRAGMGAALLCLGLSLLRETWIGPAPALEALALAVLLAGILGATSLLMTPEREPLADPMDESGPPAEPAPSEVVRRRSPTVAPGRLPPDIVLPKAAQRVEPAPGSSEEPPVTGPTRPVPRPGRYAGAPLDLRRTRTPRERGERE